MNLTKFGLWTTYHAIGEENAGEAARLAQDLGFGAVWLGGSPSPAELRPLLEGADRLVAATGILNIWRTPAATAAREAAELEQAFPDRALIGIGAGHPEATSDYKRPLRATARYLDELDDAPTPLGGERRAVAALAPKMTDLAGERSLGSHPYFVHVEHTRWARERLGAGPLLAPEVACVIDTDEERGRATAREYAERYLGLSNYTNNLLRFDFTETDIADGGSNRLIDAVIPHGSVEYIAEVVHAHIEAGADHVCVQTLGASGVPREQWTALAGALGL